MSNLSNQLPKNDFIQLKKHVDDFELLKLCFDTNSNISIKKKILISIQKLVSEMEVNSEKLIKKS